MTERSHELLSRALLCLKETLGTNGLTPSETAEEALTAVLQSMVQMLFGFPQDTIYSLASLDPGTGKTEALCAFLRTWKAAGFVPANGALIVLTTRKEIESCIGRSGLQSCDFAILVQKGHELNDRGFFNPEDAPVLFTTQEKLRRECEGHLFAKVESMFFRGRPRHLRVWDEAFLPAKPETVRKDHLLQPLADLRPLAPVVATSLESFGESLSADSVGKVVHVPTGLKGAQRSLYGHLGGSVAERLGRLDAFAGREAAVVNCNSYGLHLAGAVQALPADFAPALILDASGRVRETYRNMEAAGTLQRLPGATVDYNRLRVHHWDRAASRSAMNDAKARREVLEALADVINSDREPWLVIHLKDRDRASYNLAQELRDFVDSPNRLSLLHWGNHHGTNDYRQIRKVAVIGLWNAPQPAYAALHVASGGSMDLATNKGTLGAVKAGEHRHNLLQAICRASVRQGDDGVCGPCEVYLVGKLGTVGQELLQETFPGADVDAWSPAGHELSGSALKVAQAVEGIFAGGAHSVGKATLRAHVGYRSGEGLSRVLRQTDFKAWAKLQSFEIGTRAINRLKV